MAGVWRGCRCMLKRASYGWRLVSSRAEDFFANVTPSLCGPAVTGIRTFKCWIHCLVVFVSFGRRNRK